MTAQWTAPGQRWRLLAPANAVVIDLPSRPLVVRRTAALVRALPDGSPVILVDRRPGSRRTRRIASGSALLIQREYIALPSLRAAIMIVEDSSAPVQWTCRALLTPPPGSTWAHPWLSAGVAVLRRFPWLVSSLAVGRVVVGRAG